MRKLTMKVFSMIEATRPSQWHKNFLVLVAPIAAGMNIFLEIEKSLFAVIVMILSSGMVYVFNDLNDRELDKRHSKKRNRPIASGRISTRVAIVLLVVLSSLLLLALLNADKRTTGTVLTYLTIQINYCLWAKNTPVLEMMLVSSGFLIRVLVGASLFDIAPSVYLLGATTLGSVAVVVSKRFSEALRPDSESIESQSTRRVLKHYSLDELKAFLVLSYGVFIVFFALWAFEDIGNTQIRYVRAASIFPLLIVAFRTLGKSLNGKLERPEHDLFADSISLFAGITTVCLLAVTVWAL